MLIIIHYTIDINCRDKTTKITYLLDGEFIRSQLRHCNVPPSLRLVCSSISQQHCHPQAGHDSSKDRGQGRFTHSQGTQSAIPTPLGLPGLPQSTKLAQSKEQPLHTRSKTIHSQLYDEGISNRVETPKQNETQLKPTGQFRVVLCPNVAKTTQLQPKTRVLQQSHSQCK